MTRLCTVMIGEFEDLVEEILSGLGATNLSEATEIVSLIMEIRGYGPVKKETAEKIRGQISGRLGNSTQITEKARKIAACWLANRKKK